MNMFEFYSGIESRQSPETDAETFDDVAMNRAEIQRIADIQDHNTYQLMEVYKLINTLKSCGVDRSILFMYNKNNELSKLSGVVLPSLEDYDNGSRVSARMLESLRWKVTNSVISSKRTMMTFLSHSVLDGVGSRVCLHNQLSLLVVSKAILKI